MSKLSLFSILRKRFLVDKQLGFEEQIYCTAKQILLEGVEVVYISYGGSGEEGRCVPDPVCKSLHKVSSALAMILNPKCDIGRILQVIIKYAATDSYEWEWSFTENTQVATDATGGAGIVYDDVTRTYRYHIPSIPDEHTTTEYLSNLICAHASEILLK